MAVSGLQTIRKLLGVGELLYFETELLMCVLVFDVCPSLRICEDFCDQAISSPELASVGWVPHAKLLSFSIAMLISHDNATTFHFARQIHFKGVF